MTSHFNEDIWQAEQAFLTKERERSPGAFIATPEREEDWLERIGITTPLPARGVGYLKYSPLDFIVEEILESGVITVDGRGEEVVGEVAGTGTIYADLIKVGISTLDAAGRIAEGLGIDIGQIGYAGIKDAGALTAQRISIRGVSKEAVSDLSIPNVVLQNLSQGKGVMTIGGLHGNRFTLFVRTKEAVDAPSFTARIEAIQKNGVPNYYAVQRFGTPRLLSHVFGKHLLQGDLEGLVKVYLSEATIPEWPYVADLRKTAAEQFGNWQAMREILQKLPHTFRFELIMLDILIRDDSSKGYQKIMHTIKDQVNLWARSYASYLTNLSLSRMVAQGGELPETIPLLLSEDSRAHEFYKEFLKEDGTENFLRNLKPFRFIHIARAPKLIATLKPTIHGYKILDDGVALSFDLPRAAYATTILMHLFESPAGSDIPEWVGRAEHDTKEILETGSVTELKKTFHSSIREIIASRA